MVFHANKVNILEIKYDAKRLYEFNVYEAESKNKLNLLILRVKQSVTNTKCIIS
jgi:hypothetical protein